MRECVQFGRRRNVGAAIATMTTTVVDDDADADDANDADDADDDAQRLMRCHAKCDERVRCVGHAVLIRIICKLLHIMLSACPPSLGMRNDDDDDDNDMEMPHYERRQHEHGTTRRRIRPTSRAQCVDVRSSCGRTQNVLT